MSEISLGRANPNRWTTIGGPSGGKVAALAIGREKDHALFAGTQVGLYRTRDVGGRAAPQWTRLPEASLEIMALAVSPFYIQDRTLLAGTAQGLFVSRDEGDHWEATRLPILSSMILALCFSPNYEADGIVLAGTLQDGILYSDTQGESWSYRGFGLLDATVYSLAISPGFAYDEMIFAGTETALYHSYNSARAWKRLNFPEDAAPILSLALSPDFSKDRSLYAGTEKLGLYRTNDLGGSWQKLSLPASCVNAMAISPEYGSLLAATESGLYCSEDEGYTWTCLLDTPNVLSLAVNGRVIAAGAVDDGVWLTSDRTVWRPFLTIPARPLLGMALSPRFEVDPVAFLYGPQEGIWRTADGGLSWECLNEKLPSLDVRSVVTSPGFPEDRVLVAASADGIWLSKDAGDSWSLWSEEPATLIACSPNGMLFAAASVQGAVRISGTPGGPWESASGPWNGGREVLALALDNDFLYKAAVLDRAAESLSIWEGQPGGFNQALSRPVSADPIVAFWVPAQTSSGGRWYASLDSEVWEFQHSASGASVHPTLIFEVEKRDKILSLTGAQDQTEHTLFACAGETIYRSRTGKPWTAVHHFGNDRAIALALSPTYLRDSIAFALLFGGAFCRGILER